jgi:hypothetical protein
MYCDRIRWAEHVAYTEDKKNAYKTLLKKSKRERSFEKDYLSIFYFLVLHPVARNIRIT